MAIIIGTDANGYVTYVNQPDVNRTLFENIKDVYPETELTEINDKINELISTTTGEDVTSDITFTNGQYTTFILIKAVKIANILFIQGSVTPTTTLSASASNTVVLDLQTALNVDSRAGFGITSDKFYGAYVTSLENNKTKVNIKKIDSTNWPTTDTVGVTLIIPLANEPESAGD